MFFKWQIVAPLPGSSGFHNQDDWYLCIPKSSKLLYKENCDYRYLVWHHRTSDAGACARAKGQKPCTCLGSAAASEWKMGGGQAFCVAVPKRKISLNVPQGSSRFVAFTTLHTIKSEGMKDNLALVRADTNLTGVSWCRKRKRHHACHLRMFED